MQLTLHSTWTRIDSAYHKSLLLEKLPKMALNSYLQIKRIQTPILWIFFPKRTLLVYTNCLEFVSYWRGSSMKTHCTGTIHLVQSLTPYQIDFYNKPSALGKLTSSWGCSPHFLITLPISRFSQKLQATALVQKL